MQKLKAANLFQSDLIPVSGKLVARYNQCLILLGLKPTKFKKFSIDGMGWSPELAKAYKNMQYLNIGDANPHAIIISPQQKNLPLYMPFHTFDKKIMKQIFNAYEKKIEDITRDCAICVDIDQFIDAFYEPLDILKYQNISIGFRLIDNLDKEQLRQLKLIETFKEGSNFIDENIHLQLLGMAKKYGDLRNRDLTLQELEFTTDSFYTKAFGGVFVLRDFISPILVFEEEKFYKEAIKDTVHDVFIYHIKQPELIAKLRDHIIITYDLEAVVKTERYERIKKYLFTRFIKETQNPLKDILSDNSLFKNYLNKLDLEARKKVMCVERYLEKLEVSNQYKIEDIIDEDVFIAMHQPHSSLTAEHQDLIWKLLVTITPFDPLHLYWYDKEGFYKAYETWNDSYKEWVIECIRNSF